MKADEGDIRTSRMSPLLVSRSNQLMVRIRQQRPNDKSLGFGHRAAEAQPGRPHKRSSFNHYKRPSSLFIFMRRRQKHSLLRLRA